MDSDFLEQNNELCIVICFRSVMNFESVIVYYASTEIAIDSSNHDCYKFS